MYNIKSVIPICEPDTHVAYLAIMNEVVMTHFYVNINIWY
jgi:hypothetical protein